MPDAFLSDLRRLHRDPDTELFLGHVSEATPGLSLARIISLEAAAPDVHSYSAALGIIAREAAAALAGKRSRDKVSDKVSDSAIGSGADADGGTDYRNQAGALPGLSSVDPHRILKQLIETEPRILNFLARVASSLVEHDCARAGGLARFLRSFTRNRTLYSWLLAIEGDMVLQSGRFTGVERISRILERLSRRGRTMADRAPGLLFAGSLAMEEHEPGKTLEILEPLLESAESLPARTAVRLFCLAADALVISGRFEEAGTLCETAGKLARTAKDTFLSAVADTHTGLVRHLSGDGESALLLYSGAAETFLKHGTSRSLSVVKANCSLLLADLGDLDAAVTMQEEAYSLAASTGDHAGAAKSLVNLGNLHRYSGAFPRAMEIYNRAALLYPDSPGTIGLYANLAVTQMDMLLFEQAGRNLEMAAEAAGKTGSLLFLQRVKAFQGDLFLRLELPAVALEQYREVMDVLGRAAFGGIVLGNAASAMERLDADKAEILDMYDEASEIAERGMAGAFLSFVRRRRASVLLDLGREAEALAEIRKILESAAVADSKVDLIDAKRILAEIHRVGGNPPKEEAALEEAVALVEKMLPEVAGDMYRAGFMESIYPLYADLAALRASSRPGDALATLEKGRTRALAARSNLTPVPAGLVEKAAWLDRRMEEEKDGSELHSMLMRERRELQARIEWRKERFGPPETGDLGATLNSIVVDGGAAVISYSLSSKGLTILFAGRKGVTNIPAPCDADALRGDCLSMAAALDDIHGLGVLESLKLYPWRTARRLARTLIEPVLPYLGDATRLFIIRESFLHVIPFELLPVERIDFPRTPDPGFFFLRPDMFLGFRFDIAYTYSAELLRLAGRETAPLKTGRKGSAGDSPDNLVIAPLYGISEHERIPFAAEEAEFTAERLGRGNTLLLRGKDVSPETYKAHAGDKKIIHFAAHAIAGEKSPYDSGILMPGGRSMLTLHRISSTPLRAGLVFLSACSTGAGAGTMSEGVIGLTRSFIKAGAEAVVSTLWRVEDQSASMLVGEFYERFCEGMSSVEALAEAKRTLTGKAISTAQGGIVSLAHPYFWAGFIHTGGEINR